jgi:uncharacterized integral membrane protein
MYSVGRVLTKVFIVGVLTGMVLNGKIIKWREEIKRARAEAK